MVTKIPLQNQMLTMWLATEIWRQCLRWHLSVSTATMHMEGALQLARNL